MITGKIHKLNVIKNDPTNLCDYALASGQEDEIINKYVRSSSNNMFILSLTLVENPKAIIKSTSTSKTRFCKNVNQA
jgi:hypothetical protein